MTLQVNRTFDGKQRFGESESEKASEREKKEYLLLNYYRRKKCASLVLKSDKIIECSLPLQRKMYRGFVIAHRLATQYLDIKNAITIFIILRIEIRHSMRLYKRDHNAVIFLHEGDENGCKTL